MDSEWELFPEAMIAPTPVISAFTGYSRAAAGVRNNNINNIHRRAIQLLKKIDGGGKSKLITREFRHMMRERQRREKLSQSYADLYSIMSYRSKADKNSIVQSAAVYVRELKEIKEEMRRRNEELINYLRLEQDQEEKVTIRPVANPLSSPIDSIITALRCLKGADAKATSIRSHFSDHAVVTVPTTKVKAAELERLVEKELMEVEQKLRASFDRSSGCSHYRHVEK